MVKENSVVLQIEKWIEFQACQPNYDKKWNNTILLHFFLIWTFIKNYDTLCMQMESAMEMGFKTILIGNESRTMSFRFMRK